MLGVSCLDKIRIVIIITAISLSISYHSIIIRAVKRLKCEIAINHMTIHD